MSATSSSHLLVVGAPVALTKLTAILKDQPWPFSCTQSPAEALRHLRTGPRVDIVLLVPDKQLSSYIELCRAIKLDDRTSLVSVLFALSPALDGCAADIYAAGADDCIRSCAPDREILLRLVKAIRVKHATDMLEDASAIVTALAGAVEAKDHYTYGHTDRVAAYCVEIGRRLGIDPEGIAALNVGGVVHDIGKVGIPDHVLNKPGRLTDEEMAIMRRHPVIGYDILKPMRTFQNVLPIVRWHHERPNGTGYPDGLVGDQMPILARITAVADVFDALSTDRPYRPALPLSTCQTILTEGAAKGDLDPEPVRLLLEILGESLPMLSAAGAPVGGI